jgi:two-component system, NtrC family, response regulator HydG
MKDDTRLEASNGGHLPRGQRGRGVRVLVVDDEPDNCDVYCRMLASDGFEAQAETSAAAALERVARRELDVLLTDITMPDMSGIELCQRVAQGPYPVPVILITGRDEQEPAILALRAGALDFLRKPVDPRILSASVERALSLFAKQATAPLAPGGGAPAPSSKLDLCVTLGNSAPMREVYQLVSSLSGSLASVLVEGESGTGKDVIAHVIHESSQVREGPFVALNCAAMPAGLLESELFGHTRGAFTDAKRASKGLFVAANHGTLLLDEIGELPLEMQPKLLRALQERTVRPIGGHEEIPFDCRLITATNRDLSREVKAKRFREDLYYRLDVVRVTVPPLRERGDDILALARHFLTQFSKSSQRKPRLSPAVEQLLLAYRWPGNVRELENCMERAVTMARSEVLSIDDLPSKLRSPATALSAQPSALGAEVASLHDVERLHILKAIELSAGNKTVAAQLLGINRRTLQRRLKHFRVSVDDGDTPPGSAP